MAWQVDESVGALSRSAARADDDLAPFLAPPRRSYVFGGLAAAAARFIMWLLPELQVRAPAACRAVMGMLALRAGTDAESAQLSAYVSPPAGRLTFLYTNAAFETGIMLAAELNEKGMARVCRLLAVPQPCSFGAPGAVLRRE